jgi:hypothetical protein
MSIPLPYISAYSPNVLAQVKQLIDEKRLGDVLLKRYPRCHDLGSNKALYTYVNDLKTQYMKKAGPLSKITYDDKIHVVNQALGLHTQISRVQGGKLKSKNEIRIGAVFKKAPLPFLRMICVHELAHLKEKEHNKAFYQLCEYMEPDYHQLEFDLRLYLTHKDYFGELY